MRSSSSAVTRFSRLKTVAWQKSETVLGAHTAIKIVAAGEEFHLPVTALAKLFQAHKVVNVILPIVDPHLFGAEIAPEASRSHVPSLYLSGAGRAGDGAESQCG